MVVLSGLLLIAGLAWLYVTSQVQKGHQSNWFSDFRLGHYRSVYRLDAFSIMPNHAHVVFKPLPLQDEANGENESYHSLASIMQSLKGFTAYKCNRLLGREGEFWAHESFDHFVRDYEEWMRIIAYVLNNPVKAGYVSKWQEWRWSYRRNAN
jgi:REP element-mobilizing transposase RayT